FTKPACVVLGILLAVSVTLMVRRGDRSFLHLGLLFTAAVCAVWSWRTVPVSAMLLAPLIAAQIHTEGTRSTTPARFEKLLVVGISVLALGGLAVAVPRTADQPPSQPSWIDPALASLPAGTN